MCVLKRLSAQNHLVLLVALLALPWPGNAFVECAYSATTSCSPEINFQLYSHMEDALVHNKEALFHLRELFFPALHTERLDSLVKFIKICVTIDEVPETKCQTAEGYVPVTSNFSYCNVFQWTSSALLSHINFIQLMILENVFTTFLYSNLLGRSHFIFTDISLHLKSLPCAPSEKSLHSTEYILASWAKSYATYQQDTPRWKSGDVGYILISHGYWDDEEFDKNFYYHKVKLISPYIELLLTCIYALNNICLLCLKAKTFRKFGIAYVNLLQNESAFTLQWIGSTFVIGVNILYVTCSIILALFYAHPDLIFIISHPPVQLNHNEFYSLMIKIILIPIVLVSDISIAIATTHSIHYQVAHGRFMKLAVSVHFFVIWNYLAFVQIMVGMVSLPLVITVLIEPIHTAAFLGTILLTIVSFLLVIVNLYKTKLPPKAGSSRIRTMGSGCVKTVGTASLFGLFIAIALSYQFVFNSQVNAVSTQAVMTLLPYISLYSIYQWARKKWIQRSNAIVQEDFSDLESVATDLTDVEMGGY